MVILKNKMEKELKIIWILKIIILVLLITFLIEFNYFPKTDCEDCKFIVREKEKDIYGFLNLYFKKCIDPYKSGIPNIPTNFTIKDEYRGGNKSPV